MEEHLPDQLKCPISLDMYEDPVILAADGFTYSRKKIEEHFDFCASKGKPLTSPMTDLEIKDPDMARLIPNMHCRSQVAEYKTSKTLEWQRLKQQWK